MGLRELVRRLVYGPKASSGTYVEYLRSLGMVIGDDTVIYSPTHCTIDVTRPWMIEIGRNVSITEGVTILTHGYDWSVLKGRDGWVLGSAGHVCIGDNVFVGMNSTILKGVTVGDNVVIGAGSVVTKNIPMNCVVAGNPAHVISDVDSYIEKRKRAQIDEAIDLYACWRKNSPAGRRGEIPPKNLFSEFFWLFESRCDSPLSDKSFEATMRLRGSYEKSMNLFRRTEPEFKNYEDFLAYLGGRLSNAQFD